jgi:hypothetical protein
MFELSLLPALLGGFGSAILLIAEHYGLKRAQLKRTNAYIAGLLALWIGYLVTMAFAGRGISICEVVIVTSVGGATVKALYWIDRQRGKGPRDEGQLQEALKELKRLSLQIEARDVENRVLRNQVSDFKAMYVTIADIMEMTDKFNTMIEHTTKAQAVGQAGIRLLEKIKSRPGLPDKVRGLVAAQGAIEARKAKNKE